MSQQAISMTVASVFFIGCGVAIAQQPAARMVAVCAPPGGVWGPGNAYRGKIEKYADNTMVVMNQNVASAYPNRWDRSPSMPLSGGRYVSTTNVTLNVSADGDGYKITSPRYTAHFSCVPVAGAAPK